MNIGIDLKRRREELGLTLEQVAQHVGVGKSTVRKWETGFIKNMKRDKIQALAEILKVSPVVFIGAEIAESEKPITKDELSQIKKEYMEFIIALSDEQVQTLLEIARSIYREREK